MTLTDERIFTIADELDVAGTKPTQDTVRKALGGGSFATIGPILSRWRANKAAKALPMRLPAPAPIAARLQELGIDIWASALQIANSQLDTERASFEASRMQLEAEVKESAELADHITAELDKARSHVSDLEAAAHAVQTETARLRAELATQTGLAATATARAGELEKRADDLNAALERVNEQNSELLKALSAATTRQKA